MNKLVKRAIVRAALTNFELACVAGIAVIIADMTWLAHDILVNGFSTTYGFIGTLMLVGLGSTIGVVIRHNNAHVVHHLHNDLRVELKKCKRKSKAGRK